MSTVDDAALDRAVLAGAELVRAQSAAADLAGARAVLAGFLRSRPAPGGVVQDTVSLAGRAAARFRPDGGARRRVLHAHGGGFTAGSPHDCGGMLGLLAVHAQAAVLACEYRLAPEHPFPAALDDVAAALDAVLDPAPDPLTDDGTGAGEVVVSGDSAGGALVVGAVLRRLRAGLPVPAGVLLFSPLLDLTADASSYDGTSDRMLSRRAVRRIARVYAPGRDPADPDVSPLFAAPVPGFPPTAVYAGSGEVLRDDATRFACRVASGGVPVRLVVERDLPHVWPVHAGELPAADRTLADAAAFVVSRTPEPATLPGAVS